jgi:hypothetical protein
MNRRPIAVLAEPAVGYAVPVAVSSVRSGKRPARRAGAFPGFKVRMLDFYRDEIRAAAKCIGANTQAFCYQALREAAHEVAARFGVTPDCLVKLSRSARSELAAKQRSVFFAVKKSGQLNCRARRDN